MSGRSRRRAVDKHNQDTMNRGGVIDMDVMVSGVPTVDLVAATSAETGSDKKKKTKTIARDYSSSRKGRKRKPSFGTVEPTVAEDKDTGTGVKQSSLAALPPAASTRSQRHRVRKTFAHGRSAASSRRKGHTDGLSSFIGMASVSKVDTSTKKKGAAKTTTAEQRIKTDGELAKRLSMQLNPPMRRLRSDSGSDDSTDTRVPRRRRHHHSTTSSSGRSRRKRRPPLSKSDAVDGDAHGDGGDDDDATENEDSVVSSANFIDLAHDNSDGDIESNGEVETASTMSRRRHSKSKAAMAQSSGRRTGVTSVLSRIRERRALASTTRKRRRRKRSRKPSATVSEVLKSFEKKGSSGALRYADHLFVDDRNPMDQRRFDQLQDCFEGFRQRSTHSTVLKGVFAIGFGSFVDLWYCDSLLKMQGSDEDNTRPFVELFPGLMMDFNLSLPTAEDTTDDENISRVTISHSWIEEVQLGKSLDAALLFAPRTDGDANKFMPSLLTIVQIRCKKNCSFPESHPLFEYWEKRRTIVLVMDAPSYLQFEAAVSKSPQLAEISAEFDQSEMHRLKIAASKRVALKQSPVAKSATAFYEKHGEAFGEALPKWRLLEQLWHTFLIADKSPTSNLDPKPWLCVYNLLTVRKSPPGRVRRIKKPVRHPCEPKCHCDCKTSAIAPRTPLEMFYANHGDLLATLQRELRHSEKFAAKLEKTVLRLNLKLNKLVGGNSAEMDHSASIEIPLWRWRDLRVVKSEDLWKARESSIASSVERSSIAPSVEAPSHSAQRRRSVASDKEMSEAQESQRSESSAEVSRTKPAKKRKRKKKLSLFGRVVKKRRKTLNGGSSNSSSVGSDVSNSSHISQMSLTFESDEDDDVDMGAMVEGNGSDNDVELLRTPAPTSKSSKLQYVSDSESDNAEKAIGKSLSKELSPRSSVRRRSARLMRKSGTAGDLSMGSVIVPEEYAESAERRRRFSSLDFVLSLDPSIEEMAIDSIDHSDDLEVCQPSADFREDTPQPTADQREFLLDASRFEEESIEHLEVQRRGVGDVKSGDDTVIVVDVVSDHCLNGRNELKEADLERMERKRYLSDRHINMFSTWFSCYWNGDFHVTSPPLDTAASSSSAAIAAASDNRPMYERCILCNSFYYGAMIKTQKVNLRRVQNRLLKPDIDFILLPIHRKDHWFLVVVCHPYAVYEQCIHSEESGSADDSSKRRKAAKSKAANEFSNGKPCILFLDSLNNTRGKRTMAAEIRKFLSKLGQAQVNNQSAIWKGTQQSTTSKTAASQPLLESTEASTATVHYTDDNFPEFFVKAPSQPNSYDCGVFMLLNLLCFGLRNGQLDAGLDCRHWYSAAKGAHSRKYLRDLVQGIKAVGDLITKLQNTE